MPIDIQQNNGLLIPSEDMVFGLELKKLSSKRHSSSKTAKESSVFPQSNRSPKDADKSHSKNGVGPRRSDPKQKAKQVAEGNIQNHETVKRSAIESDELVRHMSNLPGYLLHTDGVGNVQEKAFNVGVLDWSRLEKWKGKHIPALASHFTSSNRSESSSRAETKSCTSAGAREKLDDKTGFHSSRSRSANKECVTESTKPSFQNMKRFESPKSGSKSIRDEQQMTALTLESFGKTHTNESLEKKSRSRRTTGNGYIERTSHVGNVASKSRRHRDDVIEQKMEGLQEYSHKKKERSRKSSSDMGQTSVKSKNKDASFGSEKTSSGSSETRKKVERLQESDFDNNLKHGHSKRSNIVLVYPHEIPHSSSSNDFRLSELRTSSDENFPESSRSSLSYVSIPEEFYTEYEGFEIPLSGALHSEVDHKSCSETIQHCINTDLGNDNTSLASEKPGLKSGASIFEKDLLDTRLSNQCAFASMKESLDQETAELTAQKGMNPSHNRRFSFSLSRISRSFSFKEGPTAPPVSSRFVSAMSGPVTPETSARWDNSSKEKANIKNKTRSSPLRRLLDPILKHKASSDTRHSAESSHTHKGSTSSISFKSIGVNESLQVEKSKGTLIQGLLHLTIINGVPLFKFVLNNERNIYAATRNGLASQEKNDLGCCLTFYLVNEIKKKSGGWMSHGNREKSYGYAYNIVAQMKFSSSNISEPISPSSKRQRMVKEYVLLGVDVGQTDQGPPKFIQRRELAAVVIGTPCENSSKGQHGNDNFQKKECLKCFAEERCLCNSRENDISGSTTVILPGGVHGSPNKGEPSPLIHRWKTGGSCDCGGWDIGCKLRVLCEPKQSSNIPRSYKTRHDRFQLFVQEGDEQDPPVFTLSRLKNGFFSVEFGSTVTHLQAFFISVAVLSSQKLPGSLEIGSMHEEMPKEPISRDNSRLQGKAPVKYTPIPPLSPVGRV